VSARLFVDALQQREDIDSSRIAILGLSAGGYDASSFDGLYNLDTHRDMFLSRADQSSSEGLSD
jgi:predicted peptidase